MLKLLRAEPAAIAALISALIALGAAFGLRLSTDQIGALSALVAAVSGLTVRSVVTPNVPVATLPPAPVPPVPPSGLPPAA